MDKPANTITPGADASSDKRRAGGQSYSRGRGRGNGSLRRSTEEDSSETAAAAGTGDTKESRGGGRGGRGSGGRVGESRFRVTKKSTNGDDAATSPSTSMSTTESTPVQSNRGQRRGGGSDRRDTDRPGKGKERGLVSMDTSTTENNPDTRSVASDTTSVEKDRSGKGKRGGSRGENSKPLGGGGRGRGRNAKEPRPRVPKKTSGNASTAPMAPQAFKIVIRHLPPTLSMQDLLDALKKAGFDLEEPEKLPMWKQFVVTPAKAKLPTMATAASEAYSRCYLAFSTKEPAMKLYEIFQGHRFVDPKLGTVYTAHIEKAAFPSIPSTKRRSGGRGGLAGRIFDDPEYLDFVKEYNETSAEQCKPLPSSLLPSLGISSAPGDNLLFDLAAASNRTSLQGGSLSEAFSSGIGSGHRGGKDDRGITVTPLMLELRAKRRDIEARKAARANRKTGQAKVVDNDKKKNEKRKGKPGSGDGEKPKDRKVGKGRKNTSEEGAGTEGQTGAGDIQASPAKGRNSRAKKDKGQGKKQSTESPVGASEDPKKKSASSRGRPSKSDRAPVAILSRPAASSVTKAT